MKTYQKMKTFLAKWPIVLFLPLTLCVFFIAPAITERLTELSSAISYNPEAINFNTLTVLFLDVICIIISADLAFLGLKLQIPFLYEYSEKSWKEDFFYYLPASQRPWYFLAVLGLFMLVIAIILA